MVPLITLLFFFFFPLSLLKNVEVVSGLEENSVMAPLIWKMSISVVFVLWVGKRG